MPVLAPADVIAGAELPSAPNAYVIGCYDTRITFYSQQVRALELAHALLDQQRLQPNAKVAVIGAGAAGLTAAAALALQGGVMVRLFEKSAELLQLQQDSTRRRLDPFLYEWPKADAVHEFAELPILDWRSGSAQNVRAAILRDFTTLAATVGNRIQSAPRHDVLQIEPSQGRFILHYERDTADGDRETRQEEFDVVILAIGFGIESRHAIGGIETPSYWHDGGVLSADIEGKANPAFFVSGNGDGGLIDLIAAASRDFSHDRTVHDIAARQGVQDLALALLAIDERARDAERNGDGFDFLTAYDEAVLDAADRLGLIDQMRRELRPGVRLVLQTQKPELLVVSTALLNRFAVYLLIKACEREAGASFQHLICEDVTATVPTSGAAAYDVDCGGTHVPADRIVARRGPRREQVMAPFAVLLDGFSEQHANWVRRFPEDSIAPALSAAARSHFTGLAAAAHLPPPPHRIAAVLSRQAWSARLSIEHGNARWTGTLLICDAASVWNDQASPLELEIAASPEALGAPLAHAIARLAIHAAGSSIMLDVASWRPFIETLTSKSTSAAGLSVPQLRALSGTASALNPSSAAPDAMAARLNQAMDLAMLARIDAHLRPYFAHGDDPARAVSFEAAMDLRIQMSTLWDEWHAGFLTRPDLLSRFLGLALCAEDNVLAAPRRAALVGPRLQQALIRTCAMALAVATAWPATSPRLIEPGNLARQADDCERTGHACGAGFIGSDAMSIAAMRHMWTTDFILLPMETAPWAVLASADLSFSANDDGKPLLDEVVPGGKLMVTIDQRFQLAARESATALANLLIAAETDHFERLKAAVDSAGGAGAYG